MSIKLARRAARRGLSLLEVMIVLIILVGLMAVVGPRLLGTQKRQTSERRDCRSGNVVSASNCTPDMRSFPNTEEGLDLLIQAQKTKLWLEIGQDLIWRMENCLSIPGAARCSMSTNRLQRKLQAKVVLRLLARR